MFRGDFYKDVVQPLMNRGGGGGSSKKRKYWDDEAFDVDGGNPFVEQKKREPATAIRGPKPPSVVAVEANFEKVVIGSSYLKLLEVSVITQMQY